MFWKGAIPTGYDDTYINNDMLYMGNIKPTYSNMNFEPNMDNENLLYNFNQLNQNDMNKYYGSKFPMTPRYLPKYLPKVD
jgi:hypothetical protein